MDNYILKHLTLFNWHICELDYGSLTYYGNKWQDIGLAVNIWLFNSSRVKVKVQ